MTLQNLSRHQLRYILFRLKSAETGGARLTQAAFHDLIKRWGFDLSKAKSRALLAEIKNHFSAQLYFTGWANFAQERSGKSGPIGASKSWDIGMIDGDGSRESRRRNIARMVNRPNKWFLFERGYFAVVPTRGLAADVTGGLDYFQRAGLAGPDIPHLRETRIYPDRSGQGREFDYKNIYEKGLTHGSHNRS